MATQSQVRYAEQLTRLAATHPMWAKTFTEEERWSMVSDDLTAGRSVSALLIAVVSLGLVAILTTLLALALTSG